MTSNAQTATLTNYPVSKYEHIMPTLQGMGISEVVRFVRGQVRESKSIDDILVIEVPFPHTS